MVKGDPEPKLPVRGVCLAGMHLSLSPCCAKSLAGSYVGKHGHMAGACGGGFRELLLELLISFSFPAPYSHPQQQEMNRTFSWWTQPVLRKSAFPLVISPDSSPQT